MAEYREIGVLDKGLGTELNFYFEVREVIRHPSTKKIVVGKRLVEKEILSPTVEDKDILVTIFLFGNNQGDLNGKTLIQEEDALVALNDLSTHTLDLGKHSGTYYIRPESVIENVEYNRNHPFVISYDILFLEDNI